MLIDALSKEKDAIREEGRKEGHKEGELVATQRMLEQLLQRRLGEIPTVMSDRLHQCTLAQLNTLINPALDAATWEEFATHLPPPAATNEP